MLSRFSPLRLVPRFLSWCVLKTLPFPALQSPSPHPHPHHPALDRLANTAALIASLCGPDSGVRGAASVSMHRAACFFGVLTVVVWVGMNAGFGFTFGFLQTLAFEVLQYVWDAAPLYLAPSDFFAGNRDQSFVWSGLGHCLLTSIELLLALAVTLWFIRLFVAHCLRLRADVRDTGGEVQRVGWWSVVRWVRRVCWMVLAFIVVRYGVDFWFTWPIAHALGHDQPMRTLIPNGYWSREGNLSDDWMWLNVIGWVVTLTCFATLLVFWFRARLAHRISALDLDRHCSGCGYALEGIATNADHQGVCPECGVPFVRNA